MMTLLLVRHAIAEEREVFAAAGKPDDLRPLTPKGGERMRRGARGLRRLIPELDVLATSPLVRAAETARIIAKEYVRPEPVVWTELAPGYGPKDLLERLNRVQPARMVAVVGHQPDLSEAVCELLVSGRNSFIEFKKGGACLIEFQGSLSLRSATLRWTFSPKQLRRLGD